MGLLKSSASSIDKADWSAEEVFHFVSRRPIGLFHIVAHRFRRPFGFEAYALERTFIRETCDLCIF